jgi:1,2-phenylacetyl-CoA epoxidase catalytic subunit
MEQFNLPTIYHKKLVDWQESNFPQIDLLSKYWDKHFPRETPFAINVKLDELADESIPQGMFKGQPRIERAKEMRGNMLYSAIRIIKAQCSTELGSIQQHICTLDATSNDSTRFKILRVMAEEFRHAYQMFWVLSHDDSWSAGGVKNLANTTIEELLAMHTGTHVLDAFNINFVDPLDNIVFAFLIDRVGKYQLQMQKAFAYAPMARSMPPMLREESFHLKFGYEVLREVALEAALGNGTWGLDEIQRRINCWLPRGLEMFGNPETGETNVVFSFKDRLNGAAVGAYYQEVRQLIDRINVAITRARNPDADKESAKRLVRERPATDLLMTPDPAFFRVRGTPAMVYQPIATDGTRIKRDDFELYLQSVLPCGLLHSEFYTTYLREFRRDQ